MEKVIQSYDNKIKIEHERALNREAKHILNQDLRDFEASKSTNMQLEKVQLDYGNLD